MLPIPASGTFTGVENADAVEAISGITGVTITIPQGRPVLALPEGDRYLGFVFAEGLTAESVEESLRHAAATLVVTIDGEELTSEGIGAALPE
jgi:hypothetical protein